MDVALLTEMLNESLAKKRGITLYVATHAIAMVVTAIHGSTSIEGRNQQHSRIVVGFSSVLAAALT